MTKEVTKKTASIDFHICILELRNQGLQLRQLEKIHNSTNKKSDQIQWQPPRNFQKCTDLEANVNIPITKNILDHIKGQKLELMLSFCVYYKAFTSSNVQKAHSVFSHCLLLQQFYSPSV